MYKVRDQTISDNVKHELFCLEQSKNNVLSISLSVSFDFTINGSQLAKMKKSIPDMSLP